MEARTDRRPARRRAPRPARTDNPVPVRPGRAAPADRALRRTGPAWRPGPARMGPARTGARRVRWARRVWIAAVWLVRAGPPRTGGARGARPGRIRGRVSRERLVRVHHGGLVRVHRWRFASGYAESGSYGVRANPPDRRRRVAAREDAGNPVHARLPPPYRRVDGYARGEDAGRRHPRGCLSYSPFPSELDGAQAGRNRKMAYVPYAAIVPSGSLIEPEIRSRRGSGRRVSPHHRGRTGEPGGARAHRPTPGAPPQRPQEVMWATPVTGWALNFFRSPGWDRQVILMPSKDRIQAAEEGDIRRVF